MHTAATISSASLRRYLRGPLTGIGTYRHVRTCTCTTACRDKGDKNVSRSLETRYPLRGSAHGH